MKKTFLILLSGFLGGIAGSVALNIGTLEASSGRNDVSVYNTQDQRVGYVGSGDTGQGTAFLFDADGGIRVQMGTYPAGSEKGQSLLGLHDRAQNLRLLFRLHGADDSPHLILKDKNGRDRIVIGLRGANEDPYFQYTDSYGAQKELLQ